jgi:hypothetical protein
MTVSPDGADKLPELRDAVLDDVQLAELFRDYRRCVQVVEIVVKQGVGRVAEAPTPTLDQAEQLIRSRGVRGLQVRYSYQQALWWDTLMPGPTGVRLVRILHSPEP